MQYKTFHASCLHLNQSLFSVLHYKTYKLFSSISESGKLFSFGANSEGQLGIENCSSSNEPKEITAISTHKYKQLSAGADHSAALTGK